MGGLVCAVHRRKNKGFPTLKRTLNLGIEKGRLLKNSRPKGGLIQVICYPASPETVDITGFFEKFCIAIRTTSTKSEPFSNRRRVRIFRFLSEVGSGNCHPLRSCIGGQKERRTPKGTPRLKKVVYGLYVKQGVPRWERPAFLWL